jgi:hypothetical protein
MRPPFLFIAATFTQPPMLARGQQQQPVLTNVTKNQLTSELEAIQAAILYLQRRVAANDFH